MVKAKNILLVCTFISFAAPGLLAQQAPQYTQYMFNGLVINPAYAGSEEVTSLTFLTRNQWVSMDGAPVTQTLSAHSLLGTSNVGAGINIVNDKIGVHQNQYIQGNVSYRLKVGEQTFLSMGLQSGVHMLRSRYSSISSGNDPLAQDMSNTSVTLGAGFYLKSPRFELGLSVPGILPDKISQNDTTSITWATAQYFLYSKYRIDLRNNLALEPSMLLKYMNGLPFSYDVNLSLVIKKALSLGLSYRGRESLAFILKAKFTPQLQFGYGYDYPIGPLAKGPGGSHELMINYLFIVPRSKVVSPR